MRYFFIFTVVYLSLASLASISHANDAGSDASVEAQLPAPADAELTTSDVPDEVSNLWKQFREREYLAAFGTVLMLMVLAIRKVTSYSAQVRRWLENKLVLFLFSLAITASVELSTAIAAGEKLTFMTVIGLMFASAMVSAGSWNWAKKLK